MCRAQAKENYFRIMQMEEFNLKEMYMAGKATIHT